MRVQKRVTGIYKNSAKPRDCLTKNFYVRVFLLSCYDKTIIVNRKFICDLNKIQYIM